MSDDGKLADIQAAASEFQDSVLSSREIGSARYPYSKNKQTQSEGSTANVVTFTDTTNDTAYTVSVNISAVKSVGKKKYKTDDRLVVLQAAVKEFLEHIHEEL